MLSLLVVLRRILLQNRSWKGEFFKRKDFLIIILDTTDLEKQKLETKTETKMSILITHYLQP